MLSYTSLTVRQTPLRLFTKALSGIVSQTMAIAARPWRLGRLVADQDIFVRRECTCQAAIDTSSQPALEEPGEECCRFIRNADDLVGCLTIEFEIELGGGLAVIPVGEKFEFAPPQRPRRKRGAFDGNAHTRRLPGDAVLLCDRFGAGDNAARDKAFPTLVLAREHENQVAFADVLTAIHRLLRGEHERLGLRIANLGLGRESHASPLTPEMSINVTAAVFKGHIKNSQRLAAHTAVIWAI